MTEKCDAVIIEEVSRVSTNKVFVTNGGIADICLIFARTDPKAAHRGISVVVDESIRYANQRQQFGAPLARHQAIQMMIADMATRVDAACGDLWSPSRPIRLTNR